MAQQEKSAAEPASLEEIFRYSKSLEPLPPEATSELTRLQTLDVGGYSEADVRAEVIDPVLKILGYQKQTSFSVERGKHLKILEKDLYIDYSVTLFEENFWVIEAKRVKRKKLKFVGTELLQALQYAAHPDINAALLVLCDGRLFEVYDREESLVVPVARIDVKKLASEFDILRAFLSPWQAWFFQKRRLLRMVDKVLDHEMNMRRLEELRYDVNRRLVEKRSVVLRNYQQVSEFGGNSRRATENLSSVDTRELVDLNFFIANSRGDMDAITQTLVSRATRDPFHILHPIFPDRPRDTNDNYWTSALHFLLAFEATDSKTNMLPGFLRQAQKEATVAHAAEKLIALCLSTFDTDSARKTILQYSASARRVAKILMVTLPGALEIGNIRHVMVRQMVNELDVAQFLSSPEGHSLRMLDEMQYRQTAKFCLDCQGEHDEFRVELAKQKLKELLRMERTILGDGAAYRTARIAANLREIWPTECAWVVFDSLGHNCLCAVGEFPKWAQFVLARHRNDIERLAECGSWKARELLGLGKDTGLAPPSVAECANRFFDGDESLCRSLLAGYGHASIL